MKSILELSEVKAYRYFMESSNYCSLDLPKYIDFSKVLTYVEGKVGKKSLDEILKDKGKKPSEYEGVNHRILIKKDAKFMYRPIDVANPYLYYLLVRQITTKGNWKEIKRVFLTFVSPNIEVISILKVKGEKEKSHKSAGITDWWENVEQKTFILSLKYRYMFVTDITNCYGSIYTHSIAWALMGKELAKKKKGKPGLLGNMIDTYMQGTQYGQTNGIPQGGVLFDFIAEIVLGYADSNQQHVGGLSRVASILEELSEHIDIRNQYAPLVTHVKKVVWQRLGYIFEKIIEEKDLANELFEQLRASSGYFKYQPLSTSSDDNPSNRDSRWKININVQIELEGRIEEKSG